MWFLNVLFNEGPIFLCSQEILHYHTLIIKLSIKSSNNKLDELNFAIQKLYEVRFFFPKYEVIVKLHYYTNMRNTYYVMSYPNLYFSKCIKKNDLPMRREFVPDNSNKVYGLID